MSRVVAVHQPNLLPWLGFFDKAARCDVLVLHDAAQFSRAARTHRVQIRVEDRAEWITVPVVGAKSVRALTEARIDDAQPWRGKMVGRLKSSYRGAAHFDAILPLAEEVIREPLDGLTAFNEAGLRRVLDVLGIEVELVRSSEIEGDATGNLRNLELVRALGGDVYLSGDGAGEYQEDEAFAAAGVELRLQGYAAPEYDQGREPFVAGLSILDPLMHLGPERTRALLD